MDYEKELSELVGRHRKEMHDLKIRYAESVSPVHVGDKLEDHHQQGIAKSWCLAFTERGKPSLVYICDGLTKAGKPSRRNPIAHIRQSGLRKINGKEYTG